MIKEIIQTGATVESAIDDGCLLLGIDREKDEFQFDILERPRKALFGLKTIPAKVRVYIELPDPKPESKPKPKAKAETTDVGVRVAADPVAEPPAETEHKEKRRRPRRRRKGSKEGAEAAAQQAQPQRQEEPVIEPDEQMLAKADAVAAYIKSILAAMGAGQADVTPRFTANGVRFTLSGPDLGVVIGRRGETLDALQYLSGLVANRMEGDYLRITIDSGNYREKRERTLEALARKLALQAVRTGKSQTLEPMNPYERRIIHAAVSQIKGATSSSIGEEPARRVVIKSTLPAPTGEGSERHSSHSRKGGRGGRGGRGGSRGERPANNKPQSKVINSAEEAASKSTIAPVIEKREPKRLEDQEIHLYGKIEL